MSALELSGRLIELYNKRDLDGMMAMFSSDVEFIRPGPEVLTGRAAVKARYETDWVVFDESQVEVVRAIQDGDEVAAEIRMSLRRDGETLSAGGAVFHSWNDGHLWRYRAYLELAAF